MHGNAAPDSPPQAPPARSRPGLLPGAVRAALWPALAIATLTTCEAATGPKSGHVVLVYAGDTALTAGQHTAAVYTVTIDGSPYANGRLVLHSSDTTVVAILSPPNGGDTLVARGLGTATVTTHLANSVLAGPQPALTTTFLVGPKSVQFDRPTLGLGSLGDTTTVAAHAYDANNTEIGDATFTWSTTDTTIARVTTKGRITAVKNGAATIHAVIGADTASLAVSVTQKLAHFTFTPPVPVTLDALGADTTVSASGIDSLGNAVSGSPGAPTWGLQSVGVVTVSNSGQLQAVGNGTTYVYATHTPAHDSLQVTVAQRATRIIVTAPGGLAIPAVGGTLVVTASSFDRLNNPIANATPTLASIDPTIAQVNSATRTITGIAVGTARIVAREDLTADTVLVQVANLPVKLSLSVDTAVMNSVGDTLKIVATLTNNIGGVVNGLTPFWFSSDTTILSVATQDGRVVAVRQGTARIIATYAGLADTALVTVTNAPASIKLQVHADTLHSLGDTMTLAVKVLNSRGAMLPPTSVTWSTDDRAIATVVPGGTVTARGTGRTTVRVTSGILADSAALWVTNDPARVVLNSHLDTLTARGQTLGYTATVTNRAGQPVVGDTVQWTSSNPGVASVSTSGVVTALASGTTLIIARVGIAADTAVLVMRNPTLLYVDNSTLDTLHFGTLKRPFARIQDGVAAAGPGDTVFVRVGAGPYSESVSLSRDVVVEGDPTAYRAGGNDPTKLPLLSHDTGTAGISAITTARISIRTLAIRHTLDGAAITSHGASIAVSNVYVNPAGDPFNSGRGFYIDSTSTASVDSCKLTNIRGYGIQLHNTNNASVTHSQVFLVHQADASSNAAGIEVDYGTNNLVSNDFLRWTYGPLIFLDSTASVTVTGDNVAGGGQLIRVLGATGASQVSNTSFDTRAEINDLNPGSSAADGRSGLELNTSPGIRVTGNSWLGDTGSTAAVDAIRLIGTRGGSSPTVLQSNAISGGRYAVRSEQSTWTLQLSRIHGAALDVVLSAADTATLVSDSLQNALSGCVQANGAGTRLSVMGGSLVGCGPAGVAAITMNAAGGALDVTGGTTFVGAGERAIVVGTAHHVAVVGNVMAGRAAGGSPSGSAANGVVDLQADSMVVVGNAIAGYPSYAAIALAGGVARADSNFLSRNQLGFLTSGAQSIEASTNDVFDNDTAGVVNEVAAGISLSGNWWGDSLGPRSIGGPSAVGDSVVGNVTVQPVGLTPLNSGSRPAALRPVRGNGQSVSQGTTAPLPLAIRVVDAAGRPVPGVAVTFTVSAGSGGASLNGIGPTVTVSTNGSGLAEASLTMGTPGTFTVTASNAATGEVTFTEAATQ